MQVVYPVLDPVTRSKVEFVRTKDPADKPAPSSFSLSSWASSFSSSRSAASSSSKKEPADSSDATAVISELPAVGEVSSKAARLTCNSTSFTPLLPAYANPYQHSTFVTALRTLGW
jgi:hypothetical protein